MDLTPTISVGRQHVEAYGDGGFRVSGKRWQGSVLVFSEKTIAWPAKTFAEIEIVPDRRIEVVIVKLSGFGRPVDLLFHSISINKIRQISTNGVAHLQGLSR